VRWARLSERAHLSAAGLSIETLALLHNQERKLQAQSHGTRLPYERAFRSWRHGKIAWLPIASQITCASPGRTSGLYVKIALPSASQVISKQPGMPRMPLTRNPARK